MLRTRYYQRQIELERAKYAEVGETVWIDGCEWKVTEQGLEQVSRFEDSAQ